MNEAEVEINHESERRGEIRAVMSFVLVLAILFGSIGVAVMFVVNKVESTPGEVKVTLPTVVTMPLEVGSYSPKITSEGVVRSRREVRVAAEVSGKVVKISDQLIDGGAVEEGEVLAWIDKADYTAALARAESSEADAVLNRDLEIARQKQAERDWLKLRKGNEEIPDLVKRVPHLKSAEARLASATEEVERAVRDLERTEVKAPFSGRIREAGVEKGAVLVPGSMVAELYSDEDLEVRLPFSLRDFGLVPEEGKKQEITLTAQVGARVERWPAVVDRIEGEVERSTLSGYAIARVLPSEDGNYPKVGLFVRTEVSGTRLDGVAEIPRRALRGSSEVWVVVEGEDSIIEKRTVEIVRTSREEVVVRGDFEAGDRLVLTRLNAPVVGMKVLEVKELDEGEESKN
ncbi:efflux RND transporter periplasmic adaptor subunit [Haloferula chungangensis]|uniref:Efflux RND transporter periplasmic adaptor subunit n=1 Tax=Haloferula chungangensis TaxID=1048331 RepID=A0ABW2L6Y2_9BACT